MRYCIEYLASVVKTDIPKLSQAVKKRLRKAIEERLAVNPVEYGKPLRYSMNGCRRLRVGDYRIIYKIEATKKIVLIVKIGHRREVYEQE